uniref:Uncharacterized protein n=1 Tax=Anopheles coluzzii TaxID=1518534 RepID=A0A8W7PY71_ANOCL
MIGYVLVSGACMSVQPPPLPPAPLPPPIEPLLLECVIEPVDPPLLPLAAYPPDPFTRASAPDSSHGCPWASVLIRSRYRAAARVLYFRWIGIVSSQSSCASRNSLAFRLPPTFIFSSSMSFHLSIDTDRTKDRCTPRPRCLPEHSRQIQMPYVTETHWGLWVPHSKHFCKGGKKGDVGREDELLHPVSVDDISHRAPVDTFHLVRAAAAVARVLLDVTVRHVAIVICVLVVVVVIVRVFGGGGALMHRLLLLLLDAIDTPARLHHHDRRQVRVGFERRSLAGRGVTVLGRVLLVRDRYVRVDLPVHDRQMVGTTGGSMMMVMMVVMVHHCATATDTDAAATRRYRGARTDRLSSSSTSPSFGSWCCSTSAGTAPAPPPPPPTTANPPACGPLYRYAPIPAPPAPAGFRLLPAPGCFSRIVFPPAGWFGCFRAARYTITLLSFRRFPYAALCCSFSEMMFTFRSSVSILSSSLHARSNRSFRFIASMIGSGLEPSRSSSNSST